MNGLNQIMYSVPDVAGLLLLLGAGFVGVIIGGIVGVVIGRAWMQKQEPAAWITCRKFQRETADLQIERERLQSKLKAVRMAVEEE